MIMSKGIISKITGLRYFTSTFNEQDDQMKVFVGLGFSLLIGRVNRVDRTYTRCI